MIIINIINIIYIHIVKKIWKFNATKSTKFT